MKASINAPRAEYDGRTTIEGAVEMDTTVWFMSCFNLEQT